MRIGFICSEYPPTRHGGIGTFVQALGRELVARGHEVHVLGYDGQVERDTMEHDRGVQVLRMPVPAYFRWQLGRYSLTPEIILSRQKLSKRVTQYVRRHRIDVVESYDWSGPLWSKPPCPLIVRMHGANAAHSFFEGKRGSRVLAYFERRNLRMADQLVAVSEHMRETTLQAFNLGDRRCDVIYNGIDTSLFAPLQTGHTVADRIVYVGRLHRRKGIRELFTAWPLVVQHRPAARLVIIGTTPPPSDMDYYLQGLQIDLETIEFTGHVPHGELPGWYASAAACVFPSRAEAFGLTCAEAMACGSAVVMTSLASGPELIKHEVSGLLADPRHPQEFASAILRLLNDSALQKTLGDEARKHAVRLFDASKLVDANLALYERVIAQSVTR